ncbi:protein phosphatase 1 regulatory subunit 37 [Caerostris extrusa]|uniref:Protein phosphatase 1 regulatory subunit 37 n=1 Tax=Caerostris extrusa TaxID=172846 RepID=A0AAV4XHL7_CAEEX|nr:protein phosphatase 1 regulatory subunit 37 [Caerostris extrusa]
MKSLPKGMPCVSRTLTSARALRRLNLGSNALTSAGVLELKQSFICNRTIEILELENAKITSEDGLTALSEAVSKNLNIVSLKVDPTSMDLSEPIKDRQERLQEINKCCQRNKEAKSSLPPQDAQLSFLFNGIFSHVLPTTLPADITPKGGDTPPKARKGRFRVSVVVQDSIAALPKPPVDVSRSMSLDASYCSFGSHDLVGQMAKDSADNIRRQSVNVPDALRLVNASDGLISKPVKSDNLVLDRVKWLEGLEMPSEKICDICSCKDNSEVFHSEEVKEKKEGLSLSLSQIADETPEGETKVRRSSSPTISKARPLCAARLTVSNAARSLKVLICVLQCHSLPQGCTKVLIFLILKSLKFP